MDKLISVLLSTRWGRSFIGWTSIASFSIMVALGLAYLDLLGDYKTCQQEKTQAQQDNALKSEAFWRDRIAELKAMHRSQDSMFNIINRIKKR